MDPGLVVRIRDRDVRRILAAPVDLRHWRALRRMFSVYEQPGRALIRYLTNAGRYPWEPGLRTPSGVVRPVLTSYHDLLTVNEVFCRQDYGDGQGWTRLSTSVRTSAWQALLPDPLAWCPGVVLRTRSGISSGSR